MDPALANGMIVAPGETTSYSVVISPPGSDRIFLHCPGANDTFSAADLLAQSLRARAILHFGYPPLMRGMYRDGGADLAAIMQESAASRPLHLAGYGAARSGVRGGAGGLARRAATGFALRRRSSCPASRRSLFMLNRAHYDELRARHGVAGVIEGVDSALLTRLAGELLSLGARIVGLKWAIRDSTCARRAMLAKRLS